MPGRIRVGTVIGSSMPPVEEAFLKNISRMLEPDIQLELIANYDFPKKDRLNNCYIGPKPPFPLFGPPSLQEMLASFWSTHSYIRKRRPDVLFHYIKPYIYGFVTVVEGIIHRIPKVSTIAGEVFLWHRIRSGLSKISTILGVYPFALIAFHKADHIFSDGEKLIEMLNRVCIPADKITVAHFPIDKDLFFSSNDKKDLRRELGIPVDETVVLTVGRLGKVEEVGYFPEIVRKVITQDEDFFFMLVGKTNDYQDVIKKECGDYVRIVGEVPHTEMPKYYRSADILMHLSLTEASVSGAIIEAISCDLPVVCTPAGEARNLLPHVYNSPEEFADFLLGKNWDKTNLPPEFKNEVIRKRYEEIFKRLVG